MAAALAAAIRGAGRPSKVLGSPRIPEWLALPGFDEYLLGFKDRSLMVDAAGMTAVIPGGNGIFRSTLLCDGRVVGTWKRVVSAEVVRVDVTPLQLLTSAERSRAEEAWLPYAAFLGRSVDVKIRPANSGTAAPLAPSKASTPPTGSG